MLSINFMPGAVYSPAACIQVTLKTARKVSFPLDRLIFEIVEVEKVRSSEHLMAIVDEYRNCGFKVAIDDFGAGWSGVNLLAGVSANIVKLDMALTRNLGKRPRAAAIVDALVKLCVTLDIDIIAEGIETIEEYQVLRKIGVRFMQGYLFAKPAFEQLPEVALPILNSAVA
jgi:EAL domain-containing protein (putative c-di-GMP-specific phosphodiesterase class I)